MHAASCHSDILPTVSLRVLHSRKSFRRRTQKDDEAISAMSHELSAMSHERVILSAAKNLGRYADLCNQALAVEHGLEV